MVDVDGIHHSLMGLESADRSTEVPWFLKPMAGIARMNGASLKPLSRLISQDCKLQSPKKESL